MISTQDKYGFLRTPLDDELARRIQSITNPYGGRKQAAIRLAKQLNDLFTGHYSTVALMYPEQDTTTVRITHYAGKQWEFSHAETIGSIIHEMVKDGMSK